MERKILTAVLVVLAAVVGWALSASTNRSSDALPPLTVAHGASHAGKRTVVVPSLSGDYAQDYGNLHRLGLRVTIPDAIAYGAEATPAPARSVPGAGTRVRVGSTIRLVGQPPMGVGSPAVPRGPLPVSIVPDLVGKRASAARAWTTRHTILFAPQLGPLRAGNAPTLFDNYRVTRQRPRPGTRLKLGIARKTGPNSGSFRPTPLIIWARQTRR